MKISQDEIDAAINGWFGYKNDMRHALEAAYRVRKERKKAKRESKRSILDDDQQAAIKAATPKPLTFEVGKSYRTRDGRRCIIYYVNEKTIKGMVQGAYNMHTWWLSGRHVSDNVERALDLISEWQN